MVEVELEAAFLDADIQEALARGDSGLPIVTSTEGLSAEDRILHARRAAGMLRVAEALLGTLPEEVIGETIADGSVDQEIRDTLLSPSRLSDEARSRVVASAHGIAISEAAQETSEAEGTTETDRETSAQKASRLSDGNMTETERARAEALIATYEATRHVGEFAVAA